MFANQPSPQEVARRLDRCAFNRPTLRVARDLIGKFIVRSDGRGRVSAMITEVEAYRGPRDRASHAFGGRRTPRVAPLYRDGGTVYVYLVYGMHWLLNFSAAGEGKPEGVLVRGILADDCGERMATERSASGDRSAEPRPILGPGRVTRYLQIDKTLDGADVTTSTNIWLEDRGVRIPAGRLKTGPRIGIDYAGPYWAARPWRFWIDARS